MNTYKLTLGYDGTDFRGWQRQPEERTVQGDIEEAVFRITGERIAVHGAGRTDSGVHARSQVASFRGSLKIGHEDLARALNAVLDDDVRIFSVEPEDDGFHARKSARSKIYEYRIIQAPIIHPFDFRFALHWPYRLDLRAMRAGASLFARVGDFSAFSANRELVPVRKVVGSEIREKGDEIVYVIEAEGFLRYMVRTIVGTLLEIGKGKFPLEKVEEAFARKERSLAGPTAPAKGLCLSHVFY